MFVGMDLHKNEKGIGKFQDKQRSQKSGQIF